MKARGDFSITLVSPATPQESENYSDQIAGLCDQFKYWHPTVGLPFKLRRLVGMFSEMPMPIFVDRSESGAALIQAQLALKYDLVVCDFLHGTALFPNNDDTPSVIFTHNVETEIFERQLARNKSFPMQLIWRSQTTKMRRYEGYHLSRFDLVVAVSQRDKQQFEERFGIKNVSVIPTAVDLELYPFETPKCSNTVSFCGSMDWLANQDGISWFYNEVWPKVKLRVPTAKMCVIGRNPPTSLLERTKQSPEWKFSGFVEDVRPLLRQSSVSVIPLRIGGGTRMKAFESMALGVPVVSTTIGVEGLEISAGTHYLQADEAPAFADKIVQLLQNASLRDEIAADARAYVEAHASHLNAARVFSEACRQIL